MSPVLRAAVPSLRGVVGSGFGGDTFSLDAFMASQSAGFWYDFTRSDTMFQEDVGPTPADEPNEVIGLALSQRLWGGQTRTGYLAGQPELWTNPAPTFDLAGGGSSPSYNQATRTLSNSVSSSVSGYPRARFGLGLTAGRVYRISGRIDGDRAGINVIRPAAGGSASNVPYNTSTGVFDGFVVAQETYVEFVTAITSTYSLVIAEISVREVSQVPATQSTTSFKPKFQTTGAAFDGTDDNLLTNYTAGSGANFLIAKVVVPASMAGTQIIAGTNSSEDGGRFRLGFTTAGLLRLSVAGIDLDGVSDLRGQTVVVGATSDVATGAIRTFAGQAQEASSAAAPVVTSTIPYRIGARNNDGAAANFFGGSIQHALAGREFIDLARFNQIANALGA